MPELVQLERVPSSRAVAKIAVRKKQLGRTFDPGTDFDDIVDLTFPAATEFLIDQVLFADDVARREGKGFDSIFRRLHGSTNI